MSYRPLEPTVGDTLVSMTGERSGLDPTRTYHTHRLAGGRRRGLPSQASSADRSQVEPDSDSASQEKAAETDNRPAVASSGSSKPSSAAAVSILD